MKRIASSLLRTDLCMAVTAVIFLAFGAAASAQGRPPPNLIVEVGMPGLARVEALVSGPGIAEPLKYALEAKDERIVAGFHAPPGPYRSIALTLLDAKGTVIGRGVESGRTIDGTTPAMLVPIVREKYGQVATAALSRQRIVLTRLDEGKSAEGQGVRAQVFGPDGREVPVRPGMLRWDIQGPAGGTLAFDPNDFGSGRYYSPPDAKDPFRDLCVCLFDDPSCTCVKLLPLYPPGRVTVGQAHSCLLDGNGTAYCWGSNEKGQLGRAAQSTCSILVSYTFRDVNCDQHAVPVDGNHQFVAIAAGANHTCAVDQNGQAWCWGDDAHGQVGSVAPTVFFRSNRFEPRLVQGATRYTDIAAGDHHTCALGKDRLIYCWGSAACGQTGPAAQPAQPRVPTAVSPTTRFEMLSANAAHTCAISGGGVLCWGGTVAFSNACATVSAVPQAPTITPAITPIHTVATGRLVDCVGSHSSGPAGSISCWGSAGSSTVQTGGQDYFKGTEKLTLSGFDIGGDHACVIEYLSGQASCWGGQPPWFGLGTSTPLKPAELYPAERFTDVATGPAHTCAIRKSGGVVCWGRNDLGQLGNGSVVDNLVPSSIVYGSPVYYFGRFKVFR